MNSGERPRLKLIVNTAPPIVARRVEPSIPRLTATIVAAAKKWADEVLIVGPLPDPATVEGAAAQALLDAVHDLWHFETARGDTVVTPTRFPRGTGFS